MAKEKVLIEVRGGTVVFVAATNKNIDVDIVDHDGEESHLMDTTVDEVMPLDKLEEYIEKALEEPGNM